MSQDIDENLDDNLALNEQDCQDCKQDEQSELDSELAKVKEDLIRATADFENIKKRLEREKAEALKFANESFARDLLPVIDALEIAANLQSGDDEIANKIKDGINLTIEQFKKCFEKYGIKEIDTSGEFNPEVHNAINYIQTDEVESGKIATVYQKGYLYNDRVLRPSMVVIAK
ncbi:MULTISPECIES: nucleotide exchange factor GrpE [Campylobacter]|uniref:Protein GrpE n=1 Tax=Campylobacter porcelli TaxID=1660073 RepID=A0A1X9SWZ9_9BACT|nr:MULTISPECIES: nucleotide exchange factor GrpE [unclassified Campylobacter]ARR00745.1 DnaK system nucleotide exchange factor GrpE [Campylobacter sp. RM6137]MCR8678364.1 nucleotide exchange factor GrpE [Campylobacter sp. RM19072]MEE3743930.1 nucleotide exchange factor GrpE [Campylobacter sp. CX2-4855-23]